MRALSISFDKTSLSFLFWVSSGLCVDLFVKNLNPNHPIHQNNPLLFHHQNSFHRGTFLPTPSEKLSSTPSLPTLNSIIFQQNIPKNPKTPSNPFPSLLPPYDPPSPPSAQEELSVIIIINISQSMSAKRSFYGQKDFSRDREDAHLRKSDDTPDEKVRILQDNLVFVNALPADASARELLQKETYFGRYGPVCKLILNPPYPNKKGFTYQAYVTYGCELDAALAIVSLDGYKLADRPLKVSFGTTKYCSHFLRGHDCPNADCFYLHRLDRKREVGAGETKIVFKEQNSKAVRIVLAHLEEVAGRILDSDIEDDEQGFPSLSEVMDYLVDKQYLTQEELDQAFQDAQAKRAESEQVPTQLQTRGVSLPDPHHERQSQRLNKSNSHSTMCTPSKITDDDQLQRKKQKQPTNPPPPQQPQSQTQSKLDRGQLKQRCERLMQSLKQNIVDKQNQQQLGARELQIQQKIEKLIIKEILKKGNNQCRSRFIKNATASREDQNRFRGIVQKYLIAHN